MLEFLLFLVSLTFNLSFLCIAVVGGFVNGRYKPAIIFGFIIYVLAVLFIEKLSLLPAILCGILGAACSAFGAWIRISIAKWASKKNKPLLT